MTAHNRDRRAAPRYPVGLSRPDAAVPLRGLVAWAGTDPAKGMGMGIHLETPL